MQETPTVLRHRPSGSGTPLVADESDPILASGIRKRIAALAALAAVAYSIVVPLDLALHASFDSSGLTSPARLKNLGMALEALVKRDGPQAAWRVTRILQQVGLSLAEAHDQGMTHRDIKPANIFLCRQGAEVDVVKVLDFGLVAGVPRAEAGEESALTGDHELLGTPAFMAPEMVVAPDEVDHRSDLYAVGCVGYWLLAGRRLFPEKTVAAQLFAHVHKELPSPLFPDRDPPVPTELEALVTRALAKKPGDRPQSARELMRALEEIEVDDGWDQQELERWWRRIPSPVEALVERAGERTA